MLQLQFTPFPVLTTDRLLLRQLTIEDEKEIFTLRTDDAVNRYLDRLKARTIEDVRKFIQKINNSISNNEAIMWGISFRDDPKLTGTICFWNISREMDKAETGYELLPAYQGKGIMQEALAKVIEYGFNTMQLQRIEAFANSKNSPSAKLLLKLHFTRDILQETQLAGKEEYADTTIYSLVNKKLLP
ncbi:MAG TPA: GNAT family N-acetyltransferase [Chitinophagaceae bacterium]